RGAEAGAGVAGARVQEAEGLDDDAVGEFGGDVVAAGEVADEEDESVVVHEGAGVDGGGGRFGGRRGADHAHSQLVVTEWFALDGKKGARWRPTKFREVSQRSPRAASTSMSAARPYTAVSARAPNAFSYTAMSSGFLIRNWAATPSTRTSLVSYSQKFSGGITGGRTSPGRMPRLTCGLSLVRSASLASCASMPAGPTIGVRSACSPITNANRRTPPIVSCCAILAATARSTSSGIPRNEMIVDRWARAYASV